jgi:2,4-dienoyl-CoA reductase-like NADH-dependent reductase (Old Yellow Enzyme family)
MTTSPPADSLLFSPLRLRGVDLPNRVLISPMCQYSALNGMAQRWHHVHLGKLAAGGAGTVMVEASAVEERGRITCGDIGAWSDAHLESLRAMAETIQAFGAVPAIQLGHAGRKGSSQRPWHGNGALTEADQRSSGDTMWQTVSSSSLPVADGWPAPRPLAESELREVCGAFASAARRAASAGFRMIEIHSAHGYLLHQFLSPLSNQRSDAYGGDFEGRVRFPLEVAQAVRRALPDDVVLSVRISSVDGLEGGWQLSDSIEYGKRLKALGVDIIDCSSGGIGGSATMAAASPHAVRRGPGFQVPFARALRQEAGIATMAVGLIVDAAQAEAILRADSADLIAIAREALYNPNWPLHAARALGVDQKFSAWPQQYGWWLARRPDIEGMPKT